MPAAVEPPTFLQFVLLSMLLHVLVVVLFGNAPGVGARRGEGWWGPLDVTLRRLTQPATPLGIGPFGERGAPAPRRVPTPATKAPAPEKPEATLEREILIQPSPIERIAPPAIERELLPPLSVPLSAERLRPAAPLEKIAPAGVAPAMAPPVELRPRERPIVPSTPIERLSPQQPERPMAPPVSLPPRESPQLPSAPVERLAPLPSERELSPPVVLPPRETPQLPAAPMERIAPHGLERREIAPPAVAPIAPASPGVDRGTRPAPAPEPVGPPAQAPARPEVSPEERLPNLWFAPRPDESMFKERRDVVIPPTEPGELPHIDREGARQRAREIASGEGSRRVINLPLPVPPEKKSKEAQAIDKSARPDCRSEYADLGLLAVPALLANAITDTGCKW